MEYTKKQYLLIGVSFVLVAIFGYMLDITSDGNDISDIQELCNALWKISAAIGSVMFFIGVLVKGDRN